MVSTAVHLLVFTQLDRLDHRSEAKFSDAFQLVVIPKHHFVRREFRSLPTANKGEDVASEEHLDDSDSPLKLCTD